MACNETHRFVLCLAIAGWLTNATGCGDDVESRAAREDVAPYGFTDRDSGSDSQEVDAGLDPGTGSHHELDAGLNPGTGSHRDDDGGGSSSDSGAPDNADDSGADGADAGPLTPPLGAFPSVDGRWAEAGPFEVTEKQGGPAHTLYYPTDLGRDGLKHPIIIWGNGTGATPGVYAALLRHWASHGFIVAAANTTWSGSGTEMLAGADWLTEENGRPGSPFFEKVDVTKVGATGHSQGGGGAIAAGADPVVVTTMPIEPGPQGEISALHGPMFILGGENDKIVVPAQLVEPRYEQATQIEAIYGLLEGATHFEPFGDGGRMRGYMTAWLRLQLMGDESAREEFYGASCGLCSDPEWMVQRNYE